MTTGTNTVCEELALLRFQAFAAAVALVRSGARGELRGSPEFSTVGGQRVRVGQ